MQVRDIRYSKTSVFYAAVGLSDSRIGLKASSAIRKVYNVTVTIFACTAKPIVWANEISCLAISKLLVRIPPRISRPYNCTLFVHLQCTRRSTSIHLPSATSLARSKTIKDSRSSTIAPLRDCCTFLKHSDQKPLDLLSITRNQSSRTTLVDIALGKRSFN